MVKNPAHYVYISNQRRGVMKNISAEQERDSKKGVKISRIV
jgi:hypothetical protein